MLSKKEIDICKNYISNGKPLKAIKMIISSGLVKDNTIIMLSSRYQSLKEKSIKGIINETDYTINLNKINFDLLDYLDQFEEEEYSSHNLDHTTEYLSRKYEEILKSKSPHYAELFDQLKERVLPILGRIPETEFSHDCKNHVKEALENTFDLFTNAIKNELSNEELFALAAFILIHDIGMHPSNNLTPKQLYKSHHLFARDYVLKLKDESLLDEFIALRISELCFYHNKPLKKAFQRFDELSTDSIRMNIIFSIFRLVNVIEVEVQTGMINVISPNLLNDTISEVEIDEKNGIIEIHKTLDGSTEVLRSWLEYLSNNLKELNKHLQKINYQYEVIVK